MERYNEGYTTVEAAFVVSLILFLTAALMLMMFYLHDRAVMYENAVFDTEKIVNMVSEPVSEEGKLSVKRLEEQSFLKTRTYRSYVNPAVWEELFRNETEEALFLTTLSSVNVSVEDRSVALSYSGSFRLPLGGSVKRMLADVLTITGEVKVRAGMDRGEFVRLCRSIKRK